MVNAMVSFVSNELMECHKVVYNFTDIAVSNKCFNAMVPNRKKFLSREEFLFIRRERYTCHG